ncbi:hypothetical protein TM1040_1659 [Ruegeria sp. TM1040]|nr:hypothetical protein TM1040_1659 [Ruegeria sp. TM1040]
MYHDGRRIASLLAQFDPAGHLQSVSTGKSAEEGRDSDAALAVTGGLPGVLSAKNDTKEITRRSHAEEIQRVYDPMWSNARALLDTLDEKGLIQRGLSDACLGQLVLVKGKLSIFDLQMVAGLWSMKSVQGKIQESLPTIPKLPKGVKETPEMRASVRIAKEALAEAQFSLDLFKDMAPTLPHTAQAEVLDANGNRVWCTMDTSGLATPPSEIALKHGTDVPGDWAMLGILDAEPTLGSQSARDVSPDGEEMVMKLFENLAPAFRTLLGRPKAAHGMTPLMVFREVVAARKEDL